MSGITNSQRFVRGTSGYYILCVLALVAFATATYWPTPATLMDRWLKLDEAYSHGLIVVGAAFYFYFQLIGQAKPITRGWLLFALAGLAAASLLWGIFKTIGLGAMEELLFLSVVCAVCLLGARVNPYWRFLMPAGLLAMALPIWDALVDPLRKIATVIVGTLLETFGFEAYVGTYSIEIPYGQFLVAGGCSGLAFLLASFSMGLVYAHLERTNKLQTLIAVSIFVAAGLLTNWVRIFSIVVVGHLYKMDHYLITVDHYYFGWVLCFIALCVAYVVVHRWVGNSASKSPSSDGLGHELPMIKIVPLVLACSVLGPVFSWTAEHRGTQATQIVRQNFIEDAASNGFDVIESDADRVIAERADLRIELTSYAVQRASREIHTSYPDAHDVEQDDTSTSWYLFGDNLASDLDQAKPSQLKLILSAARSDAHKFRLSANCLTNDCTSLQNANVIAERFQARYTRP